MLLLLWKEKDRDSYYVAVLCWLAGWQEKCSDDDGDGARDDDCCQARCSFYFYFHCIP